VTRRVEELVAVRPGVEGAPGSFVWRERVYVVREVLDRWSERRDWWAAAGARALHGGHGNGAVSTAVATLEQERVVWRVRASRGRTFDEGVYDLTAPHGSAGPGPERPGWRLRHVAD
jgi:hypothetical protein